MSDHKPTTEEERQGWQRRYDYCQWEKLYCVYEPVRCKCGLYESEWFWSVYRHEDHVDPYRIARFRQENEARQFMSMSHATPRLLADVKRLEEDVDRAYNIAQGSSDRCDTHLAEVEKLRNASRDEINMLYVSECCGAALRYAIDDDDVQLPVCQACLGEPATRTTTASLAAHVKNLKTENALLQAALEHLHKQVEAGRAAAAIMASINSDLPLDGYILLVSEKDIGQWKEAIYLCHNAGLMKEKTEAKP